MSGSGDGDGGMEGGRTGQLQPRAQDFGAGTGRARGSRRASARFPRTNTETSRFSGKTHKPRRQQQCRSNSLTHRQTPPSNQDAAGTLQRGDAGRRRRGSPAPWSCWASLAWAEPLSPQGRRVGTTGLSRKAFGCCCYFGEGGWVGSYFYCT